MPKVSTTELVLLGRNRKFEVHYSARSSCFFVKLSPEILSVVNGILEQASEAKAIERAQEILRTYEARQTHRRKVIVVHIPEARMAAGNCKSRNWRVNNVSLEAVGFELAYRVLDEVTAPNESPHYIGDRGRAEHLPADRFTAIPWTAEREQFFEQLTAQMEEARNALLRFITRCGQQPELCSLSQLPALMAPSSHS